jgi:hypothetical protein
MAKTLKDYKINSPIITHRIYAKTYAILKKNPKGVRWVDLAKKLKDFDSTFHPKTVNGCVWKLVERFPEEVYKPEKGLFKLK